MSANVDSLIGLEVYSMTRVGKSKVMHGKIAAAWVAMSSSETEKKSPGMTETTKFQSRVYVQCLDESGNFSSPLWLENLKIFEKDDDPT